MPDMPEHRFHTSGPIELDVRIPAGEIVVETVDGDEAVVTLEGSERTLERAVVDFDGTHLTVSLRNRGALGFTIEIGDISFGSGGSGRLNVRATVPHSSRATIDTAAADMKLRGRFGNVATKSASGDLVIDGTVDGDATVKTVSGDAKLQDVGGTLQAQSVSGDLSVRRVGGSLQAKSVSGDMRVESLREGEATLQSLSGDIHLGVAAGTNVDVDANSLSGDLSSDVPLGSDPSGVHGEGPTLVVRGNTVSGDFRLVRA
jgi:DUF4097 and DUF4098 domain-containing protein YvlB